MSSGVPVYGSSRTHAILFWLHEIEQPTTSAWTMRMPTVSMAKGMWNRAPGVPWSLVMSSGTLTFSPVPPLASPQFTQPESGKAGFCIQGSLPCNHLTLYSPVFIAQCITLFICPVFWGPSDMVTNLSVRAITCVPVHWLLCKVPTSICNLVKCGSSLARFFPKSIVLLITGFSAC